MHRQLCCAVPTADMPLAKASVHGALQVVVIAGGIAGGGRGSASSCTGLRREQARLCADVAEARRKGSKGKKKEKVAVDEIFYARLPQDPAHVSCTPLLSGLQGRKSEHRSSMGKLLRSMCTAANRGTSRVCSQHSTCC